MNMKLHRAIATAILVIATCARAETTVVDSLEWQAADAPLIVQAKVADLAEWHGRGQVIYRDIKLSDVKVLKGDIKPEVIAFRVRVVGDDPAGSAWKTSGDTYIFFLMSGKNETDSEMGEHWVLRSARSVVDLDHPNRVFTAAMQEATDRDEILKTIASYKDATAGATPVGEPNIFKPQRGYVRLEIPLGSPIFNQVWAGSSSYINVPADKKAHEIALALSRSKNVVDRISAAEMLLNYPSLETTKILTEMLADAAESHTYADQKLIGIGYPVRAAAYQTLLDLKEKTEKPILERPPTQAEIDADSAARKKGSS